MPRSYENILPECRLYPMSIMYMYMHFHVHAALLIVAGPDWRCTEAMVQQEIVDQFWVY